MGGGETKGQDGEPPFRRLQMGRQGREGRGEDKGDRRCERHIRSFKGVRFGSEEEALKALADLRLDPEGPFCFDVHTMRYLSEHPEDVPDRWELRFAPMISEGGIKRMAEMRETEVLVTNLDRPPEGGGDGAGVLRPGIRGGTVIPVHEVRHGHELHLSAYAFQGERDDVRHLDSGTESNIADAMFRRAKALLDGRQLTLYRLAYEVQNAIVTYSRTDNSLRLQGPPP